MRLSLRISGACSLAAAIALAWAGPAAAQAKAAPGAKSGKADAVKDVKGNPMGRLVMLHDLESARQAQIARQRMQAGDCKAALDAFDASLKGSNDPTIRRDRGLCHEKQGNAVPAIEDYRTYLTALPDAPDSPDIRMRLERLRGEPAADERPERVADPTAKGAGGKASFSVKVGTDGVDGSAGGTTGATTDVAPTRDMDGHAAAKVLEKREALEARQAESTSSALRKGTGPAIGVTGGPRFWAFENRNRGLEAGYLLAGTLRIATSSSMSIMADIGYTSIQGQGTASTIGGLALLGGAEWRIALDPYVTDALIVGAGLGYERYKIDSIGQVISMGIGRGRFGYRHVFGPSFGLEVTADAGFGFGSVVDGQSFTAVTFGPNVAAVSAF